MIMPGQLLARANLLRLLESLALEPEQVASTVYLRPGESWQFPEASTTEGRAWRERLAHLDRPILNSDTGLVALRAGPQALIILPPFPVTESSVRSGWNLSPLQSALEAEIGGLNKWVHIWPYKDLNQRSEVRAEATKKPPLAPAHS